MDISWLSFAIFFVCLGVTAYFSMCETAITSLSEAKTLQLINEHHRFSKALKLWLDHPTRVLTTILVGNNIAITLAAAIATMIADELFHNFAVSIATAVTTFLLLIFGEISPKTFARYNAVKVAPTAMAFLVPFYWVTLPVVVGLSWLATLLVRLVGGNASFAGPLATQEDIAFMIRLGHQEGVFKRQEGEMLESVIEFRDTIVREAMVPRMKICSLEKHESYDDIVAKVRTDRHSRWPVYDDNIDNVIGVFHAKDLLHLTSEEVVQFNLVDHLRPALFVPDTMKIGNLLKEFQHGKAHLAIVVDEYGGTAGIISLEDVLEELVGEIRDEYDSEEEERVIRPLDDGSFLVDCRASIHDLEEALQLKLPDNELYDSVGGLLVTAYGHVPTAGTELVIENWRFVVKQADAKKVISVWVSPVTVS